MSETRREWQEMLGNLSSVQQTNIIKGQVTALGSLTSKAGDQYRNLIGESFSLSPSLPLSLSRSLTYTDTQTVPVSHRTAVTAALNTIAHADVA